MLSDCSSLSASYQKEISHFSKILFFCCCQGEERVPCPQKRRKSLLLIELILIRTSVLPLHQYPDSLSPHGWSENLLFPRIVLVGRKRSRPLLCSNTIRTRVWPFRPNPSRKLTAVYQLGFDTRWRVTHSSFFFIPLHWIKSPTQRGVQGKAPHTCPTWKRGKMCPFPPPDSGWNLGHRLPQKRAAAIHAPWGRTDWPSHLEIIIRS